MIAAPLGLAFHREIWLYAIIALAGTALLFLVLGAIWRTLIEHKTLVVGWWRKFLCRPIVVRFRRRFASQLQWIQARFSPEAYLGLHLTLGAVVVVTATWAFGAVVEDILTGNPLVRLDVGIAAWLHDHATPELTQFMLAVSRLHAPTAMCAATALFAAFLIWRRDSYWLTALGLALPLGGLLNLLLKFLFHRHRPSFDHALATASGYSFPSGHAMGATPFYGLLAAFVVAKVGSWHWRIFGVLSAVLLVTLVGLSRMYLGVHYLSDILAAVAEGIAVGHGLPHGLVGHPPSSEDRTSSESLISDAPASAVESVGCRQHPQPQSTTMKNVRSPSKDTTSPSRNAGMGLATPPCRSVHCRTAFCAAC